MTEDTFASWGRYPRARHHRVLRYQAGSDLPAPIDAADTLLARGNGRSYGDSCLNDGGSLIDMRGLDRVLAFDGLAGRVRCEAGVLLRDLIAATLPRGWFPAVVPGTELVTVGGAIANDVHGKNHHVRGTFGRHVEALELLRSDGVRYRCSAVENVPLFQATIGGMGLTGLIVEAELRLIPVASNAIDEETVAFSGLEGFFDLAESSERHEYTVAWIDQLATGPALGRGLFMRADHGGGRVPPRSSTRPRLSVPWTPPVPLIGRSSLRLFNNLYRRRIPAGGRRRTASYRSFFFPLDGIGNWNRLYGPRGLLQHQSVLPPGAAREAVRDMLLRSQRAGLASFLTVLKNFGDLESPGLMSFPRPGTTLTLDFANTGAPTMRLLDELDAIVRDAGGAVCPYKDGRMSPATFKASFPQWHRLERLRDPVLSSSFWRRVTA